MVDNKRRFPWPVLVGDGLLLLCALTGFAGSFLSLYGDPNSRTTALNRCAANGDLILAYAILFGLASLWAWSIPRRWGTAAGGLTALWTGVVLLNWTEMTQGAGITVRDVAAIFARRVYWGKAVFYMSGLGPAQEAAAARLFLLLTLAGLALLLGGAVIRLRRWWVVVLLTLPPLLPGLLADLYPDWFSFMMLAACWCAMLFTSLCRWAAPDRRGRLTLTVFSAVALTLALITALFPLEGYTRPTWARRAQDDLLNLTNRLSDYLPHWNNGPFQSTVTYVGAAEEADLAHAGPLNYTGRAVLRVDTDYRGWMYLRGSSLAMYEDGVWSAPPGGTYEDFQSKHKLEISPLYLPAALEQDGPVYTATVYNLGAVGTCVYAPYFLLPQDVNETGMLPVEDAYFARKQGQWTYTMTFVDRHPQLGVGDYRPGNGSGGITMYSGVNGGFVTVKDGISGLSEPAASVYSEYVYDHYLDVPTNLRVLLLEYVGFAIRHQSFYGHADYRSIHPVQMAEQLSSYLETLCEYDDSAPAAPAGVDPVYYFLNTSRRGYCMHYASAVTLMLRAAGVPARYVSGFAAEVIPDRQTNIPDRAAHAWVEVWIDGFGWYPVEVTPSAAFDWARQPDVQNTDGPVADTPEPTDTPESTEPPQATDDPGQPTETLSGGGEHSDGPEQNKPGPDFSALVSVLKQAAPAIGAALLLWSVQFFVKRFRAWRMSGADANRSALVCYGYLCRLERWGGRMDEQAVELAGKARFSQHTLTQEELNLLRYLVDRERSRLCVVTGRLRRLVIRYWWGKPRPSVSPADWTPPKQEE